MTFIKYPKIKILGDKSNEGILTIPGKVVAEEKIDGANFGFYVKDNILYFCSHNQNLTDSEQIEKTGIPKNWRAIISILESWKKDPLMFNPDLYYYGESMQKHTIGYDNIPGFIGFDILDLVSEKFLNQELCEDYFKQLNLPFINIINEIDIQDVTIDYLKSLYQKSAYRNGSAEGIVIKRYDNQQMAKIVDDSFKEKNKKIFGCDSSRKQTIEDKIVDIYITDARIEKIIHKLHDDGHKLEMVMMKILYKYVISDMLEEEILELYKNYNNIDFKNLNKVVSKKCPSILKKVIMDG